MIITTAHSTTSFRQQQTHSADKEILPFGLISGGGRGGRGNHLKRWLDHKGGIPALRGLTQLLKLCSKEQLLLLLNGNMQAQLGQLSRGEVLGRSGGREEGARVSQD